MPLPIRSLTLALATVVAGATLVHVPAEARTAHARTRAVDVPPTSSAQIHLIAPRHTAVDGAGYRYVVDGTNQVLVYLPTATGDVERPARSIGGRDTKLYEPCGVAVDRAGRLYVSSAIGARPLGHPELEGYTGMITVYAPRANGNAAPIRTIVGDRTGLDRPCDLTVRRGEVYTSNAGNGSVTVHGTGADGDAAPRRVIAGPATGWSGLGSDDLGPVPGALAVGRDGTLYVGANNRVLRDSPVRPTGTISVFRPGARGNVAPRRKLVGTRLGFEQVNSLALDRSDNLYVSNGGEFAENGRRGNIQVFRKGATGRKPAAVRLGGPDSRVFAPGALEVLADGSVLVLDLLPRILLNTYAPLVRQKHAQHSRVKIKKTKDKAKSRSKRKARATLTKLR